jgi:enoyl-CoA hydratase/carnithine racemase
MMPSLEHVGDVYVLRLGDAENRFDGDSLKTVLDLVGEVANAPAPRALVTTATGKFWSLGLDLDWMAANPAQIEDHLARMHELMARVLVADFPIVAAIQGHAFAGGAMLALAHDIQVMREDRGFFCLPEIDLPVPFTPGLSGLIAARLPRRVAHEAMLTGRRYGGIDAAAAGIVDEAVPEADVLPQALERARVLAGKDAGTLGTMKERLYADVVATLRDRSANAVGAPA